MKLTRTMRCRSIYDLMAEMGFSVLYPRNTADWGLIHVPMCVMEEICKKHRGQPYNVIMQFPSTAPILLAAPRNRSRSIFQRLQAASLWLSP